MPKTEVEKIQDIEEMLDFIMKIQDKVAPHVVSDAETQQGEDRKGVVIIKGSNNWARAIQVVDGRLEIVTDYERARTGLVFEGVDTFIKVCNELLSGRIGAFARAKARGDVKVTGKYALRDGAIFNRMLTQIGKVLSGYGVKLEG